MCTCLVCLMTLMWSESVCLWQTSVPDIGRRLGAVAARDLVRVVLRHLRHCLQNSMHDMVLPLIGRCLAGVGEDGYYSPRSESVGEMSAWGISERQSSAPDLNAVSTPAASSPSASPVQVAPWCSTLMARRV